MNFIQAIILGLLQGLTEFLPVSSSGHLVLLQNRFGLHEPELLFDISLHMGTLIAVCIVFRSDIMNIIRSVIQLPSLLKSTGSLKRVWRENADVRMAGLIIAGSVPTAILGVAFHEIADHLFADIRIVGIMLLITGGLLWLTRNITLTGRTVNEVTFKDALVIGLVQGLAIVPGISRSGSTISTALFLKIDRQMAGRYSFLLSIPALVGALAMALVSDTIHSTVSGGVIVLGTLVAAGVGFVALKILLQLVNKGRLYVFAPYCWIIGCLALIFSG